MIKLEEIFLETTNDESVITIVPIELEDRKEIIEVNVLCFPRIDQKFVRDFITQQTNWSISKKAVCNDAIAGSYLLAENSIVDVLNTASAEEEVKTYEDLAEYRNKRGVEGISLAVLPAYRNKGVGRKLKDVVGAMSYDYIWGQQFKILGNLDDWLKRRRLVAETKDVYFTLQDLH